MKKWLIVLVVFTALCGGIASAQTPGGKSSEIVSIAGSDYYLHTVLHGETVYSLSKLYGVTEDQFYEQNPSVKDNGLKAGEVVKIICSDVPEVNLPRRKMQKTFSNHTVQPGETTYAISKQYSLSVNTLIQDNPGIDPTHLQVGQEILIRKSEMDKTSPQTIMSQMDDFANKLSIVSDDYAYHLVEIGETLYGISRKYGVAIEIIEENNAGIQNGLRAGLLLKIPMKKQAADVPEPEKSPVKHDDVTVKRHNTGTLNISVLLPLEESGVVKSNFLEFYQGVLIASDELRQKGQSINIDLYNTEHSADAVKGITESSDFRSSNLIIGPVYEDGLKYVVDYSKTKGMPVVSPLADVKGDYGNTLFQLSPEPENRYDKIKTLISGDKNIIFITSDVNDSEFEREMKAVVGNRPHQRIAYHKGTPSTQINALMSDTGSENVFIVLAGSETGVDLILAALSSVQNTLISRSRQTGAIKVIGSSKWSRYQNLDRNLFFKLNVSYVTSYHADRGNKSVVDFDNRYIASFGRIPTMYSYRGYDAVMLFGSAIADHRADFIDALNASQIPLETPYSFQQESGKVINKGWALVTFGNDYNISVK